MKTKSTLKQNHLVRKIQEFENWHLRITAIGKLFLSFVIIILVSVSCEKSNQTQDFIINDDNLSIKKNTEMCEPILFAGQDTEVGNVSVTFSEDGEAITVTYLITDSEWCIEETHLDVQTDPDNFPMTKKGNPKVGHFEYGEELDCSSSWSQEVDLNTIADWEAGMEIFIAAHAEVITESDEESAWACCEPFPGNNWATYFSCEPPPTEFQCGDVLVDSRDGQSYNTVQIGNQCWMAENLRTTTYRNGTPIPNVTDAGAWNILTTGAYVWHDNDISWKGLYGALYNWYAVDDANGLCPEGWHVPTYNEWTALTDFIGGTNSPDGNKLKSCRQVNSPLGGDCNTTEHPRWNEDLDYGNYGTDDYGFSLLPGGGRDGSGFLGTGGGGLWWSSTEHFSDDDNAHHRILDYGYGGVVEDDFNKRYGGSVRCLRD